jgi:hypothetical protein
MIRSVCITACAVAITGLVFTVLLLLDKINPDQLVAILGLLVDLARVFVQAGM